GARPVFIDSEPGAWNMDPNALEDALRALKTPKPKALIPVHLYGMPARMKEILDIAERYGVPVIEDAAEALGSTYNGKKCGAFGTFGILSFNGNKIITTSGGGALVGADEDLIQRSRFLATQARDPAPHYQHSQVGYNYRLSNVLAGIGRGQMEVLPERIAQRRANYERYRAYFGRWNAQGYDIRFQEEQPGMFSNRWLSCILVDPAANHGLTREAIRLALEADNIEARPLWKPMHLQPIFAGAPYFGGATAERLFDIGLCLPSGSNLTEEDFQRIFAVLDALFEKKLYRPEKC
ncbi:MAG: DegT/DnrJ/EryC1/StrS family aminotransferase, partial [Lewinella sp.]|nr:DegT/DnrJ/EryC1/StrS family aminotransferase [Lewinella sp.]